jgi:hypothetical protein
MKRTNITSAAGVDLALNLLRRCFARFGRRLKSAALDQPHQYAQLCVRQLGQVELRLRLMLFRSHLFNFAKGSLQYRIGCDDADATIGIVEPPDQDSQSLRRSFSRQLLCFEIMRRTRAS